MNVKRGGSDAAAATISRFVLPVSVTTAGTRTFSSSSAEQRDVLLHRRREDDDVRLGEDDEIVGGDVDRVQPHRRLEDVLVVDADDQRARPQLAGAQRNRPADQPEPDDADLREDRRLRRLLRKARLDDRQLFSHRLTARRLTQSAMAPGSHLPSVA